MEKNKIIERLIKEGHISFEEGLELAKADKEYVYLPYQQPNIYPVYPCNPYPQPWFYTTGNVY